MIGFIINLTSILPVFNTKENYLRRHYKGFIGLKLKDTQINR